MQITRWFDSDFEQQTARRSRLAVALFISTVLHAILLVCLRIDLVSFGPGEDRSPLEIRLHEARPETEPDVAERPEDDTGPPTTPLMPEQTIESQSEQTDSKRQTTAPAEEPQPAIDWRMLAEKAAQDIVASEVAEDRHRAEMWRQTHSVMFEPHSDYSVDEVPYLAGVTFNERRFKGIGFRIGENCFIGLIAIDPESVDSDASDSSTTGMRGSGISLFSCGF